LLTDEEWSAAVAAVNSRWVEQASANARPIEEFFSDVEGRSDSFKRQARGDEA
jgi:hypothetical protein